MAAVDGYRVPELEVPQLAEVAEDDGGGRGDDEGGREDATDAGGNDGDDGGLGDVVAPPWLATHLSSAAVAPWSDAPASPWLAPAALALGRKSVRHGAVGSWP
jgi:hypothetical protein